MRGMEALNWIGAHWLDLIQSAGIITAFLISVHTIRREAATRRISTLLELTKQHFALWRELAEHPDLLRVVDRNAALDTRPVTPQEQRFVTALILHLDDVHRAMKSRMFVRLDGLRLDVRSFFALPIVKAVWQSVKPFQNKDFVRFVDDSTGGAAQ